MSTGSLAMKTPLLLAWLSLCVVWVNTVCVLKNTYRGAQVIQVDSELANKFLRPLLNRGDVEQWFRNRTHMDVFLPGPRLARLVKTLLKQNNINYIVTIKDVQKSIDAETFGGLIADGFYGPKVRKMSWTSYHSLKDIYSHLDFLAARYPQFVKVGVLGRTMEGRPIKYIVISSGKPHAKKFWLDGGIHAREWVSVATVSYLVNELVVHRNAYRRMVENIDFYAVPVYNPDGYEYTRNTDRFWRKNRSRDKTSCYGVDLNRNGNFHWGGRDSSREPCDETFRGSKAASEAETRAVFNFILKNRKNMEVLIFLMKQGFITFHSYGQYILIPYGYDYNSVPPDFKELEGVGHKMARAMKSVNGNTYQVGNSANLLYAASGGSDDWAKGVAGIKYVYTIELRDLGKFGFTIPPQYIIPTALEAMAAVQVVANAMQGK